MAGQAAPQRSLRRSHRHLHPPPGQARRFRSALRWARMPVPAPCGRRSTRGPRALRSAAVTRSVSGCCWMSARQAEPPDLAGRVQLAAGTRSDCSWAHISAAFHSACCDRVMTLPWWQVPLQAGSWIELDGNLHWLRHRLSVLHRRLEPPAAHRPQCGLIAHPVGAAACHLHLPWPTIPAPLCPDEALAAKPTAQGGARVGGRRAVDRTGADRGRIAASSRINAGLFKSGCRQGRRVAGDAAGRFRWCRRQDEYPAVAVIVARRVRRHLFRHLRRWKSGSGGSLFGRGIRGQGGISRVRGLALDQPHHDKQQQADHYRRRHDQPRARSSSRGAGAAGWIRHGHVAS